MCSDKGISAFPDGDKLFEWIATVHGPADSVYEGLKYKLLLEFPASYPYSVPRVRFVTPFDSFGKALKSVINATKY